MKPRQPVRPASGVNLIERNKRIWELSQGGLTHTVIATRMDLTVSQVGVIVRQMKRVAKIYSEVHPQ